MEKWLTEKEAVEVFAEKVIQPMVEKWVKEYLEKHVPRWTADEYQGKMLISYEEEESEGI